MTTARLQLLVTATVKKITLNLKPEISAGFQKASNTSAAMGRPQLRDSKAH